jgi:HlyD family secretion protein
MNNQDVIKWKRARYWGMGLVVVLIGAFFFLRFDSARASNGASEPTATVTSVDVADTVQASGALQAEPSATLTWNTSGVVEKVNVKVGDKVKAGDVLSQLKSTSVSSSVISAQSDLVTAQENLQTAESSTSLAQAVINLKTAQDAYDKAASYLKFLQNSQEVPQTETRRFLESGRKGWMYVTKTKTFKGPAPQDWIVNAKNDLALKQGQLTDAQNAYDRLKAGEKGQDVAAAQAKVDAAKATVDSMSIIAPFDGEVLFVDDQPGDVVSSGADAANVANLDHLYVDAQVDETDIANIKAGDPVTATLDAVPGVTLTGKVASVNLVGTLVSGLVKYTARVDFDKTDTNLSLPLGTTANVSIQVKPASATLAVPVAAIQNDSQGEFVWAIRNGSPRRVNIVGGQIVGDRVAVTGKLKAGDVVELGQVNNNNNFGEGFFRIFGGGRQNSGGRGNSGGQGSGQGGAAGQGSGKGG